MHSPVGMDDSLGHHFLLVYSTGQPSHGSFQYMLIAIVSLKTQLLFSWPIIFGCIVKVGQAHGQL